MFAIFGLFPINIEILILLFKSWDFWYMVVQAIALSIEFSILLRDHRIVLAVCGSFNCIFCCCLDALPYAYRKHSGPIQLNNGIYALVLLLGIHYDWFPNIIDYQFQFQSIKWEVRQMVESTIFIFLLWSLRFSFFCFVFPNDAIFLKSNIRRQN